MSFDLALTYRAGPRERRVALASEARVLAVTGPSGAGKTSLLDCLAGLRRPLAGRIAIGGARLFDSDARIDLPPEERRAGYAFQDMRLFPHLAVRRNLAYGAPLPASAGDWPDLAEVADLLDLAPLLDRRPRTLSGGEARRVAIGRALLARPAFLLLDEPLASLDAARKGEILPYFQRLRDETKLPMIYVSHDSNEVKALASRVVLLDDGRVKASGGVELL